MEQWNYATNVLVALIGAAIVVLLGFNIWYSFNMNSIIKKQIDLGLGVVRKENETLRLDLVNHIAASLCLTEAKDYTDKGWIDIAFLRYIKAIEHLDKIEQKDITSEIRDIYDICLDSSMILVKKFNKEITDSGAIYNMRTVIEDVLIKTEDKRSNDLYAALLPAFNRP
ncbi:MAG: hypothetical protein QM660_10570 [Dysgonomonas sp.]